MAITARKLALQARQQIRRWRLEAGESGWGAPAAEPPRVAGVHAERPLRIGIIGAGAQGRAQARGARLVPGVTVAAIADLDAERLAFAARDLQLADAACFRDAAEMVGGHPALDLVCVATTAPAHVALGRVALRAGVPRILLEKPMDTDLAAARAFEAECREANVPLAVNYSRRWMPDYAAIRRCIERGMIGVPCSVGIVVGKGELAMHGSHYFDLCRLLLGQEPEAMSACLEPVTERNARGAQYEDPSGHCTIRFRGGARAFVDFSSDLATKDPFVVLKGTDGRITVDERRAVWTLQSRSQRTWEFPFAEAMTASLLFARVVANVAAASPGTVPACSGADGVAALEMIVGAHASHRENGRWVALPLAPEHAALHVSFP